MVLNLLECVVLGVNVRIARVSNTEVMLSVAEADGKINPEHGTPVDLNNPHEIQNVVVTLLDVIDAPDYDEDDYNQCLSDIENLIELFSV